MGMFFIFCVAVEKCGKIFSVGKNDKCFGTAQKIAD